MHKFYNYFLLALALVVFSSCEEDVAPEDQFEATYTVSFNLTWNEQDFPQEYPGNAHFSSLIGWTHLAEEDFFGLGTPASAGIKNMAESGNNTQLIKEINEMIAKQEGLQLIEGGALGSGTGNIKVTTTVDTLFSSLTLATMVAPSPDWYVALVNANLRVNRRFVNDTTIPLVVYDAGSDSGETYTSANKETVPRRLITLMHQYPLGNGNQLHSSIGSVHIEKQ